MAPHNTYRCKGEDRWCVITVFNDEQWESFVDALGAPAWASDERYSTNQGRVENQDDLDRHIESWTLGPHTPRGHGYTAGGRCSGGRRTRFQGQGRERSTARGQRLPTGGRSPGRSAGAALEAFPSRCPGPHGSSDGRRRSWGEHREYVYQEVLGIEEAELVELAEEGVI